MKFIKTLKIFSGILVAGIALTTAGCGGGGGSTPSGDKPSISAAMSSTTLRIPAAGGGASTLTFTGSHLKNSVTVTIADKKTHGSVSLSKTTCVVTPSAPTCTVSVSATEGDTAGSTDVIAFTSSDSSVSISPEQFTLNFTGAAPTAKIDASIDDATLEIPSSSSTAKQNNNGVSQTKLHFVGHDITKSTVVSVDQSPADLTLSASSCTLTSSAMSCDITVSTKTGDKPGSDILSFTSSDSAATIDPTSLTVTLVDPSKEPEITASADATRLAVPESSSANGQPGQHNLTAPLSATLTFTGTNITEDTKVGIADQHSATDPNHLTLSANTCTLTSAKPVCSVTVKTNSTDVVGDNDTLTFSNASVAIKPATLIFQFVDQVPTTPTVTFSPSPITVDVKGTVSVSIIGTGFAAGDAADVGYNIDDPTIAEIDDGYHSTKGKCTLSADDDYQCNVTFSGLKVGSTKLHADIAPNTGKVPSSSQDITMNVINKPALDLNYSFNATKVGGPTDDNDAKSIAHIKSVTNVVYDGTKYFSIVNGALQAAQNTPAGVYQINIKATTKTTPVQSAFNTFYVLVGDGLSHSDWQAGKMAAFNVNNLNGQPITMIYTYSHYAPYTPSEPEESDRFQADYKEYGDDLGYVNSDSDYVGQQPNAPINSMAVEFAGPGYMQPADKPDLAAPNYWTIPLANVNEDIKQQVTQSGPTVLGNGFAEIDPWMPTLIDNIRAGSTGSASSPLNPSLYLSPDLTFGNAVSADYTTYNPEQLSIMVSNLMKYADGDTGTTAIPHIAGINLDLEKGTSNENAVAMKSVADHLAYQGLYFGYYEFADKAFQPSIINAMGPLGIAYISTYDTGSTRASIDAYNEASPSLGTDIYNNIFENSISCGDGWNVEGSIYLRASWCNLSANDSEYANKVTWLGGDTDPSTFTKDSTKANMQKFNGNFSLTLPIGESSTDYTYLELIKPDFSALTDKDTGLAVTNNGTDSTCANLKYPKYPTKTTPDWKESDITNCLLGSHTFTVNGKNFHFVNFQHCVDKDGNNYPYYQCILVSANLSGNNDGKGFVGDSKDLASTDSIGHPSQADYMLANLKAYDAANNKNFVGYSLFALQNAGSAPYSDYMSDTSAKLNKATQEPWYIGLNKNNDVKGSFTSCTEPADAKTTSECDPFYYSDKNTKDSDVPNPLYIVQQAWSTFGSIQIPAPLIPPIK